MALRGAFLAMAAVVVSPRHTAEPRLSLKKLQSRHLADVATERSIVSVPESLGDVRFVDWLAAVGSAVSRGGPVCQVQMLSAEAVGKRVALNSPVDGIISRHSTSYKPGDTAVAGAQLAVIIPRLHLDDESDEYEEKGDAAGKARATLIEWNVAIGDDVSNNDVLATVSINGAVVELKARGHGKVTDLLAIEPGDTFMTGETLAICVVADGTTSSLTTVIIAICLCCICCVVLGSMGKKKPAREEPMYEAVTDQEAQAHLLMPAAPPREPVEQKQVNRSEPFVTTPPPVAASKKREPEGVRVTFGTDHGEETLYFQYHPLGLIYEKASPIKVREFHFNSYGEHKGVQQGWTIRRVQDTDVTEVTFEQANKVLVSALETLPWWPCVVEFKTTEGTFETVKFAMQPLGMIFSRTSPIVINGFKPDSYGQRMGVKEGWTLSKIVDRDVLNDPNFKHNHEMLLDGLSRLEPIKGARLLKQRSTDSFKTKSHTST